MNWKTCGSQKNHPGKSGNSIKSAVLFLTYRRYQTAERVFEAIRQAQPPRLYFASNAPNPEKDGEDQRVAKVRSLTERIDWPCELKARFLDEHLSVKYSIPSSIDWFFEHEEEGIILEDDCLPSKSFFPYCDELLKYYRDNPTIMMISGDNFQDGIRRGNSSYYFSKHCHIWGWATWRRAWQNYDVDMEDWPQMKRTKWLRSLFPELASRLYWTRIFQQVYENKIDTWDYQWEYACWRNQGLSCMPNANLVSNIGFGSDSNFTKNENSKLADMDIDEIIFPIIHPENISIENTADKHTARNVYNIDIKKELFRYFFIYKS